MFNPLMTPPQLIAAAEKLNVAFSPSPLVVLAAPVGGHPRLTGLGEAHDCHPKNAHFENIPLLDVGRRCQVALRKDDP